MFADVCGVVVYGFRWLSVIQKALKAITLVP